MEPPIGLMPCAVRPARGPQPADSISKIRGRLLIEYPLLGADAKHDLLAAAKRTGFVRHPRPRKFQTSPAKRHF